MPHRVHPSGKELRGVLFDELPKQRLREIASHLEDCAECSQAMLAELACLLYPPDSSPEATEADTLYDEAIDRAVVSSLRLARRVHRELERVPQAIVYLAEHGAAGFLGNPPRPFRGLAGLEALLARSRELRGSEEALRLANAAVEWAARLPVRRYGRRQVADLQCKAWIELSLARGAAGDPTAAREALAEAERRFPAGTGDESLEARLLDAGAALAGELAGRAPRSRPTPPASPPAAAPPADPAPRRARARGAAPPRRGRSPRPRGG